MEITESHPKLVSEISLKMLVKQCDAFLPCANCGVFFFPNFGNFLNMSPALNVAIDKKSWERHGKGAPGGVMEGMVFG